MNTTDFIKKVEKIHNYKYDYSKVEYVNTKTKVCVVCPIHGEFWITPHNHVQGRGCKYCGKETQSKSWEYVDRDFFREKKLKDFLEKAKKIHGNKYDYSKVKYVNSKTKVCIICPIHGEFMMTPRQHLISCGCYECGKENFSLKNKLGVDKFIDKSIMIHGEKYDYSKVDYIDSKTKVCIVCPEHGEFWQTPSAHIHLKEGCPKCNESHLERLTRNELEKKCINFISECSKNDLPWLKLQTLDFYLPNEKIAIECQGRQHFSDKAFSGKFKKRDFEYQIKCDFDKANKCRDGGIKLFYIVDNVDYALQSNIELYNRENTFDNLNKIIL